MLSSHQLFPSVHLPVKNSRMTCAWQLSVIMKQSQTVTLKSATFAHILYYTAVHIAKYCNKCMILRHFLHGKTLFTNQYAASYKRKSMPATVTDIVHKDLLLTKQLFSSVKIRVARQQWTLALETYTTPVIPDTELSLCVWLQQLNNVVFVVVVADVCLQTYTTQYIRPQ